jgi:hypothetical protein
MFLRRRRYVFYISLTLMKVFVSPFTTGIFFPKAALNIFVLFKTRVNNNVEVLPPMGFAEITTTATLFK